MSAVFNIRGGLVTLSPKKSLISGRAGNWIDWPTSVSEGFATYFAGLFVERYEGEKPFRDYMRQTSETYFRYAERSHSNLRQ